MLGNDNIVAIPDECLLNYGDLKCYIFLHKSASDGKTCYTITIPVMPRVKPGDSEPTPVQQDVITQAIAALNQGVERAETAAINAEGAAAHYPIIQNEYWYVWDVVEGEYVNTNIKALGDDGVGIKSTVLNDDYTLTITFTDDSTYTTSSIRGEKGEKGDPGAVKFLVRDTLPTEDIDSTAIYLIPSSDPETPNAYDEYIYINNHWELIGVSKIDIDGKVDKTQTIAGISLQANISKSALLAALNVENGAEVNNIFVAQYGVTTFVEIQDAVNAGKSVVCKESRGQMSLLQEIDNGGAYFIRPKNNPPRLILTTILSSDQWIQDVKFLEVTPNKTTEIGAESTDIQYPSAKAVYTAVERKVNKVDYDPVAATESMTQPVGKDANGQLWTTPQSGGAVDDVQIDGISIIQDGVANVPIASSSTYGVIMVRDGADGLFVRTNNKELSISLAPERDTKDGTNLYKPVVPYNQHQSAFYGLAKAAGSDEKNSTLPVGQYTEAAKSAISEMLNGAVTVEGTTPTINALPGVRYVCGEVTTLDITLPASGIVDVTFDSGSTATVLTITPPAGVTVRWANGFDPDNLAANTSYEIKVTDGEFGSAIIYGAQQQQTGFELIEEIVIADNTRSIRRLYSEGYRDILITTSFVSSRLTGWMNFSFLTASGNSGQLFNTNSKKYNFIKASIDTGQPAVITAQMKEIGNFAVNYGLADCNVLLSNGYPIKGFLWIFETTDFPSGETIYVYGIKA